MPSPTAPIRDRDEQDRALDAIMERHGNAEATPRKDGGLDVNADGCEYIVTAAGSWSRKSGQPTTGLAGFSVGHRRVVA